MFATLCQDRRSIGPLPSSCCNQLTLPESLDQHIQPPQCCTTRPQPSTERSEHRVREARVCQV
jgi:hypothetical protein